MNLFYLVVITVSIIILILSLTLIGLMMKNGTETQTFPPNTSQCPDRWIPDGSFCHFNGVNHGTYTPEGKYLKEGSTKYDYTSQNPPPTNNPVPYFTYGGDNKYSNSTTINSSDPLWNSNGLSLKCNQKKWANTYGIQWSGITQYNGC
jgi:hypothetical protein